jgi:WhiB family redox-sensing transcriptional regulator
LFFPPEEDGENVDEAKQICSECFVRDQCLESALESHETFGVWGGTTPRERRRIIRARRRSA